MNTEPTLPFFLLFSLFLLSFLFSAWLTILNTNFNNFKQLSHFWNKIKIKNKLINDRNFKNNSRQVNIHFESWKKKKNFIPNFSTSQNLVPKINKYNTGTKFILKWNMKRYHYHNCMFCYLLLLPTIKKNYKFQNLNNFFSFFVHRERDTINLLACILNHRSGSDKLINKNT